MLIEAGYTGHEFNNFPNFHLVITNIFLIPLKDCYSVKLSVLHTYLCNLLEKLESSLKILL